MTPHSSSASLRHAGLAHGQSVTGPWLAQPGSISAETTTVSTHMHHCLSGPPQTSVRLHSAQQYLTSVCQLLVHANMHGTMTALAQHTLKAVHHDSRHGPGKSDWVGVWLASSLDVAQQSLHCHPYKPNARATHAHVPNSVGQTSQPSQGVSQFIV
jgi:hypothetical protein